MSSAGNSTIQILPTSDSSQFDPIVHIFNGTPDSTKGYNVINVLISAAFPVYVRVLQSIFNGGPWDDIEYFNYPNGSPSGQGMFITVPIRAEWFYVSVENRAISNNNIRLQTIKQNSELVGSVVGVTGGVNITNFPSFFGITGVSGITGFVTTAGRDETLKTNTIYVDTTGAQRTTIVPARKDNAKYIYEMDLDHIIEPIPVDGWSLDPRGRDGWYFSGNAESSLTWFGNASQIFAPPVVTFNMLKSVYFVATMDNTTVLPKISITTYYSNTNTLAYTWEYHIDTVVNIYNGETYLFYCGNNALNLHTSYRHVPMNSNRVIGPGNEYVHDIKVIAPAYSQFLLERAGICDPSGNYETVFDTNKDIIVSDKLANLDFCGSYLNTLISGTDGVNIYPVYTDASGVLLTKLTGAYNTYIGITGMVGVSGFYNDGLVGVTGSSAITVPANTFIGITGMVGVSGFYNGGLVGVTGSSAITVPANTFIGITGMVGVSGFYNDGLVGVTGSSVITVPANTFIGITGMVGVSGFYNGGLVGVTGSSSITVPANTFIGITGIVGVSGFYNGLIGVTGSSAITVPANTFIGITGMVGVSGFYNDGLVGVTGSSSITVPANTFIGITGMVGVSGMYKGLVGVTGVNFPSYLGITGMVGVTLFSPVLVAGNDSTGTARTIYTDVNGLVGITGSSAITVPANTYIGITGLVGVTGVNFPSYLGITGLVGVTGLLTVAGTDSCGNVNKIYTDSTGSLLTNIIKTDTNTMKYNFYNDLSKRISKDNAVSVKYWSLDPYNINDGWYYDATSTKSGGVFTPTNINLFSEDQLSYTFYVLYNPSQRFVAYNLGTVGNFIIGSKVLVNFTLNGIKQIVYRSIVAIQPDQGGTTGFLTLNLVVDGFSTSIIIKNIYTPTSLLLDVNESAVWAVVRCNNIDSNKIICPPVINVLTDVTYTVPGNVKLYNGVSYLFYYGSKALDFNKSYTPILMNRTSTVDLTVSLVDIAPISLLLGGASNDIDNALNTTYLVQSAGTWHPFMNSPFIVEFGPKMSDIQVVGGTDGLLKYPIYTDVCGVQRTNIIETYKPPYKFILETDAINLVKTGNVNDFKIDPRNREGWYNNTYNSFNSLTWFDNSSSTLTVGQPITCNVATLELWMIVTCMSNSGSSHVAPQMQITSNASSSINYIPLMTNVYNNIPYLFYYGNKPTLINPSYTAVEMQRSGTVTSTVRAITIIKEISEQYNTSYLIDSAGFWDPVNKQEFSVQFRSNILSTSSSIVAYNETLSSFTNVKCTDINNVAYSTTALNVNPVKKIRAYGRHILSNGQISSNQVNSSIAFNPTNNHVYGKNTIIYYIDDSPTVTGDIVIYGVANYTRNYNDTGTVSVNIPIVLNANPVVIGSQRVWSSIVDVSPFTALLVRNLSTSTVSGVNVYIHTGNGGCY